MAKKAGDSANGRTPPDPEKTEHPHNVPTREEMAALRLRHIEGIRRARDARIAKQEEARALRKVETRLRNAYKADGFTLEILDEALNREDTPGRDLVRYEQERHDLFEDLGQAVYVQADIFEAMGDEEYWRQAGYQAGIAGKPGTPPEKIAPEFIQPWMSGWNGGQERLGWALAERGINPEKKAGSTGSGPTRDEIEREQPET
jgi:hypothetical protein